MRKGQKRVLIGIVAFFVAAFSPFIGYWSIPLLPIEYRYPAEAFYYNYLSLAPRIQEPYGVYLNKPFGPSDQITIALYDGGERSILIFHPGGDDFRHAALQPGFNVRVNAPNGREAVRYLKEYFAKIGFTGTIRNTAIFAHGSPASPMLGRSILGQDLFDFLCEYQAKEGYSDLAFISCNVAQGDKGVAFIHSVADTYNLRVIATEYLVGWDFYMKWFKRFEGEPNYEFNQKDWVVAVPHDRELKRL